MRMWVTFYGRGRQCEGKGRGEGERRGRGGRRGGRKEVRGKGEGRRKGEKDTMHRSSGSKVVDAFDDVIDGAQKS